jgi:heterodisulfide reductase subunit C
MSKEKTNAKEPGKKNDPMFKDEVAGQPGGENIKQCYACGTCTLSCPVSEVESDYSPRKIIHMILLGLKEEVLGSDTIWNCLTCYRCQVRCPQDVKYPEVMRVLRKMALEQGYVKPEFFNAVKEIDRVTQDIRQAILKKFIRKKNGITGNDIREIRSIAEKYE